MPLDPPASAPVPVVPRDAATVLLLRDGPAGRGPLVWMMRRIAALEFAAGAHVFPGGAVEPDDDVDMVRSGNSLDGLADVCGVEVDRCRRLLGAAVRETHEEARVRLDPNRLVPWAWWLTPATFARRYDTWFFATALADDVEPQHVVGGEADDSGWWRPDDLLAAHDAGAAHLLLPTIEVLRGLVGAGDVAAVLRGAPARLTQRSG